MSNENNQEFLSENVKKITFSSVFLKAFSFFLSLLLAYSIVYLAFSGKGGKPSYIAGGDSPAQHNSTANSTSATVPSSNPSGTSADNKVDTSAPVEVDLSKAPQSTAEIVAYYKAAHAKVLNEAKSVTKTYEKTSNYQDVLETGNSAVLSRIAKSIMNAFVKENTEPAVHEGSAEIKTNFPPANATCNLSEGDIASAECRDKGSYYEVEIHTKPESNPKEGFGAGALGSVITSKQINDAVSGYVEVSNVNCDYDDVYIIANIDKATGNMAYEYVHMPLFLKLTALNMNCRVGLLFEDKWEINW